MLGIVHGLVFKENTSPPSQPYHILIEFDDYRGSSAVENQRRHIVPIVAETIQFDARYEKSGSRVQFPLVLDWAIAIHNSQRIDTEKSDFGNWKC